MSPRQEQFIAMAFLAVFLLIVAPPCFVWAFAETIFKRQRSRNPKLVGVETSVAVGNRG